MTYLQWNNLIGSHLFNEDMAGREVQLFVTKEDVVRLGQKSGQFDGKSDSDIWEDFIRAVRSGIPGEKRDNNFLEKIIFAYGKATQKNLTSIANDPLTFPPYLAYLVLSVLPLTIGDLPLRANNYYDRIKAFFQENDLTKLPDATPQKNWDAVWQHLSDWSTVKKQCEWGIFTNQIFSGFVHVGLPLSQCLFNPQGIKLLPIAFEKSGFVPGFLPNQEAMRTVLIKYWESVLRQRPGVLDKLEKSDNGLGQAVVSIACRVFSTWEGDIETDTEESRPRESGPLSSRHRARLHLSFSINQRDGTLDWGVRARSQRDYPEDLILDGHPCKDTLRNGYSNHLPVGFHHKLTLQDKANRWEAALPEKPFRLFIGGVVLGLHSDSWVETDELSRYDQMHLLCDSTRMDKVLAWGKHFPASNFKEITDDDVDGIPADWRLFRFTGPGQSLDSEAVLPTQKKIIFTGGVKTGYRTWLSECPPQVEIENADGTEMPFVEQVQTQEKTELRRKEDVRQIWLLPAALSVGQSYEVATDNLPAQTFRTDDDSGFTLLRSGNCQNPQRDRFGNTTETASGCFAVGNEVMGLDFRHQLGEKQHFLPVREAQSSNTETAPAFDAANDSLLHFLACRQTCRLENFYEAFEQLLSQKIEGEWSAPGLSLSGCKRIVLNLYDALGYADFDYQSGRIVANPPQMFLLPAEAGRRALLSGVRTPEFVQKVFAVAAEKGLSVRIIPKAGATDDWQLLPDTIILECRRPAHEGYGIHELAAFAKALDIPFKPDEITQWALLHFSAGLNDFENTLGQCRDERFEDYDWTRKIFNPHTFQFERSESGDFDKSFALVEYRKNAYTYDHVLWKDGTAHRVDKGWARWLAVRQAGQQVLFTDTDQRAAYIPSGLPLPHLMAKGLLLCSGRVPERQLLEINGVKALFSKYDNVVFTLFHNEFRKIGQNPVPITSFQTC